MRLRPVAVIPITAPDEKATRRAGFRPSRARAAVRTLARTAICMPMNPALPEASAPMT